MRAGSAGADKGHLHAGPRRCIWAACRSQVVWLCLRGHHRETGLRGTIAGSIWTDILQFAGSEKRDASPYLHVVDPPQFIAERWTTGFQCTRDSSMWRKAEIRTWGRRRGRMVFLGRSKSSRSIWPSPTVLIAFPAYILEPFVVEMFTGSKPPAYHIILFWTSSSTDRYCHLGISAPCRE